MTPHDLIAAFDVLAEAPDGAKRLRELVLQLAVRGKLVPQDPEDEPASVVLERIAAERQRRGCRGSKAGEVKGAKVPFEVPESWAWVPFGDLFECRLGKMLDKAKNRGTPRKYLRNANVRWGTFDFSDILEMRLEDGELDDVSLAAGDLVICEGGEPGRCAVWRDQHPFVIQKALHRARAYLVASDYYQLHLRLDCTSGRIDELFTGATIKHLTGQTLDGHLVTLPPLAEQHRIVARVDELMGLLDRLEAARNGREGTRAAARDAALAALRDANTPEEVEVAWQRVAERVDDLFTEPGDVDPLRQAVLQLAVRGKLVPQDPADEPASVLLERIAAEKAKVVKEGKIRKGEQILDGLVDHEPFDVPQGWVWRQVGALAGHIVDGTHHTPTYVQEGIDFISAKDIQEREVSFEGCRKIPKTEHDILIRRCNPQRGNLLVTKSGSIGRVAVVSTDRPFSVFESVAVIPLLGRIATLYIAYVVEVAVAGAFGADRTKGAAVQHLHLKDLRQLPVPVPPLAEQHRIVAKVDELMGLLDRLEQRLATQGDLHDAFAAAAVHHVEG